MSHINFHILSMDGDAVQLILDLFETRSVGTGMTREIPGGATIILGGSPTASLDQGGCEVGLRMNMSDADDGSLKAISDWFRGRAAKWPNAKIMVQQGEWRFNEGELKRILETMPKTDKK